MYERQINDNTQTVTGKMHFPHIHAIPINKYIRHPATNQQMTMLYWPSTILLNFVYHVFIQTANMQRNLPCFKTLLMTSLGGL